MPFYPFAAASPYASQVLGAPAAAITFSAIPAGYSMLRLLVVGASSAAAESDRWLVQVNGDTGSDYDTGNVIASGSTAPAQSSHIAAADWLGGSAGGVGDIPGASATAGVAGLLDITIPAYAGTTFQKAGLWRSGFGDGAVGSADIIMQYATVAWRSTAAITSVKIFLLSGANLVAGTTALLYLS